MVERTTSISVSPSVAGGQQSWRDFTGKLLGLTPRCWLRMQPVWSLRIWLTPLAGKWVLIVGKMFRCLPARGLPARGLPAGCFRILTAWWLGSPGGIKWDIILGHCTSSTGSKTKEADGGLWRGECPKIFWYASQPLLTGLLIIWYFSLYYTFQGASYRQISFLPGHLCLLSESFSLFTLLVGY